MNTRASLPDGILVAFYGDDFTGSSAVAEVLTFAGIPTVLFLERPSQDDLSRFPTCRAIGIAGVARAHATDWMDRELPSIFALLETLKAPVTHYKTCSTLDSSPLTGSIGHAIDLGLPALERRPGHAGFVPLIVAAPGIGRYQAFGNLFASHQGRNFRLDRHPVMRQHPATPMDESDVALHLGRQTRRRIGLVDVAAIKSGHGVAALDRAITEGSSIVSIDVLDEESQIWAGEQIWSRRGQGVFAVGSQGIEYALTAYWRSVGLLPAPATFRAAPPVNQIVAASGSVSAVTAQQISWAAQNAFDIVAVDAAKAVDPQAWRSEISASLDVARAGLSSGRSCILATALAPDDPAVGRLNAAVETAGARRAEVNERIGSGLGSALRELINGTGITRVAIAGGDTSGHALRELGMLALTALAPLVPGSPLCRAHSRTAEPTDLEIALKGGQMGSADYFGRVRDGRGTETKGDMN